jgi:hypothetical protein
MRGGLPAGTLRPGTGRYAMQPSREVGEETGKPRAVLRGFVDWADDAAFYFDARPIPANLAKGELAHRHFGFVCLFRISPGNMVLRTHEVSGWAWMDERRLPRLAAERFQTLGNALASRSTAGDSFFPPP